MMFILRLLSFALVTSSCLTACKESEPLPRSVVSFDYSQHVTGELDIKESNGTLASFHPSLESGATGVTYEIKLVLDRPAAETTVIRFMTAGQATRCTLPELGDFEIEPHGNLITINKGETSASIFVRVFEDFELEYLVLDNIAYLVEGITISLVEVVSGPGILGENKTFSVFILEDDPIVLLRWDPQDYPGSHPWDVDMDLFLWHNGEQIAASAQPGTAFEILSYPAGFPDGQYGFSYTYYSGSSDDLKFYVDIINANLNGFPGNHSFEATYTADNKNKYDESGIAPFLAQTMDKSVLKHINLTDITVNASGSRVAGGQIMTKASQGTLPSQKLDVDLLMKIKEYHPRGAE